MRLQSVTTKGTDVWDVLCRFRRNVGILVYMHKTWRHSQQGIFLHRCLLGMYFYRCKTWCVMLTAKYRLRLRSEDVVAVTVPLVWVPKVTILWAPAFWFVYGRFRVQVPGQRLYRACIFYSFPSSPRQTRQDPDMVWKLMFNGNRWQLGRR